MFVPNIAAVVAPKKSRFYFGEMLDGVETRMPGRSFDELINSTPAASRTACT
jgi:hypothetical protein